MNRVTPYTASRAVLAITGAAAALAVGGCGEISGAAKQTAAPKATVSNTAEAPAPSNKLLATVSATGREVTLTDSRGRTITRLRSGWYSVFVTINATGADFHLTGPGVDSATKAKASGVALWGIHFLKGTYRYMNDHNARATRHVLPVY